MKSRNNKLSYKIILNPDCDAWNWYDVCTGEGNHGVNWSTKAPANIVNNIRSKSTKSEAYEYIDSYLKQKYIDDKENIQKGTEYIKSAYREKFQKACDKLELVIGKPIYRSDFIINLTTFHRAPYNYYEGMLYTCVYCKKPIGVFLHELSHFQFIHFWRYNPKSPVSELSFAEFEWLKESLTIILDEEFSDIIEIPDAGYELHRPFRAELQKFWKNNRNFDKLVDFGLSILPKYKTEIENSVKISTYEKIKTPTDLLDFMSHNLHYGFVSYDGRKYFDGDIDWNKDWYDKCIIQNGDEILKTKCGTCWDQVELERKWFSENKYDFETYFLWFETDASDDYPTHTILVFNENNKYYWFENSFFKYRGIHENNSLIELINDVKQKHLDYAVEIKVAKPSDKKLIKFYKYNEPDRDIRVQEYLDHCAKKENEITL